MREVLDAYAAHCQRQGHARVWSTHFDIWGEAMGELGMTYDDTDHEAIAIFASMVPWMLIPTIGVTWTVVDRTTLDDRWLTLVELRASGRGLEHESRHLSYSVADDGSMTFGRIEVGGHLDPNSKEAVGQVIKGRMGRIGWEDDLDFDHAVMIASGLLLSND